MDWHLWRPGPIQGRQVIRFRESTWGARNIEHHRGPRRENLGNTLSRAAWGGIPVPSCRQRPSVLRRKRRQSREVRDRPHRGHQWKHLVCVSNALSVGHGRFQRLFQGAIDKACRRRSDRSRCRTVRIAVGKSGWNRARTRCGLLLQRKMVQLFGPRVQWRCCSFAYSVCRSQ